MGSMEHFKHRSSLSRLGDCERATAPGHRFSVRGEPHLERLGGQGSQDAEAHGAAQQRPQAQEKELPNHNCMADLKRVQGRAEHGREMCRKPLPIDFLFQSRDLVIVEGMGEREQEGLRLRPAASVGHVVGHKRIAEESQLSERLRLVIRLVDER